MTNAGGGSLQIRKLVPPKELQALSSLAKGKGKIVHQEAAVRAAARTFVYTAKKRAARDAKGRIMCSNPVCDSSREPGDGQEKYRLCAHCGTEA